MLCFTTFRWTRGSFEEVPGRIINQLTLSSYFCVCRQSLQIHTLRSAQENQVNRKTHRQTHWTWAIPQFWPLNTLSVVSLSSLKEPNKTWNFLQAMGESMLSDIYTWRARACLCTCLWLVLSAFGFSHHAIADARLFIRPNTSLNW